MDRSSYLRLAALIALSLGLLVVDLLVPLGVSVWTPYVGIVLLSLWLPTSWHTYGFAAACSLMMIVGLFLSPDGDIPHETSVLNRLMGIVALWMAAILGVGARRTRQLQEANSRLEQEILERQRLQDQLLRTQRLESVGVLASGIAHDFNNLLTPILMAVKLLKEERPEEERLHLLRTLQASAERGAEMVQQLLAFAGGSDGQRITVQPVHIIHEIRTILEHSVPKNIQIVVDIPTKVYSVHADPTQLSQVLLNLCINGRDAMPNGGLLTIHASNVVLLEDCQRLHPDARPGPYVMITVTDTGTGIPPQVLDRVFDPFFTTKGAGKGTGLGLSTVLGIVRSHGGFINLSSEVGKGSRFAVYLPALADAADQPEQPPQLAPPRGQGERILVVDDEPLILQTSRATLEGLGYRVFTAGGGEEAAQVYRQHQDDIQAVLLDMMMPGMDGLATMKALQQVNPEVRIIASSGLRLSAEVAESIAARKGIFLPKPYTEEQLLTTLATVLNKAEGVR